MRREQGHKEKRSRLELREDAGGPRHYLEGSPLYAGTVIRLVLAGSDRYLTGRYEWSATREDPAYLLVRVEGTQEPASVRIPRKALLRRG